MRYLALLCLPAVACVAAPVGESQQAIVGGTTDTDDPAVVLVLEENSKQEALCTGEVVSPHVVLTAAHCLDPAVPGSLQNGTYHVYAGNDLNQVKSLQGLLAVKETHFDPEFDVDKLLDGHDIGVVILEEPLDVAPLAMNRAPLTKDQLGAAVRLVGYGITSASDTQGSSSGIKRQTTTQLSSYTNVQLTFEDSEHLTCEGDSGGPALMTIDGNEVIVGITSFGDQNCGAYGTDTRVDVYADSFVQPYIDQFDPGSGQDSDGKGSGCDISPQGKASPMALALALVAMGLVARRRRTDQRGLRALITRKNPNRGAINR